MEEREFPIYNQDNLPPDYNYEIFEKEGGFFAVVRYFGEQVWVSDGFRLECQAITKAKDYILSSVAEIVESQGIKLEVQKISIDPDTLFRRL